MKKVLFEIVEDRWEDGVPTYLVLKSTYLFGIHLFGQLYGVDGGLEPFDDFILAEKYLKEIKIGKEI